MPRSGAISSTSSRRRAAANEVATPTLCRTPAVVQAEQQRPDALAVLVHAEPGDHAVGRALVLHLHIVRLSWR